MNHLSVRIAENFCLLLYRLIKLLHLLNGNQTSYQIVYFLLLSIFILLRLVEY